MDTLIFGLVVEFKFVRLLSLTDPGFDVSHGNTLLHQRGGDMIWGLRGAALSRFLERRTLGRVG